jgi:hypothetical protein
MSSPPRSAAEAMRCAFLVWEKMHKSFAPQSALEVQQGQDTFANDLSIQRHQAEPLLLLSRRPHCLDSKSAR